MRRHAGLLLVVGMILAGWSGESVAAVHASPASAAIVSGATIAAVGDISCDPLDPNFNGGNGLKRHCQEKATAGLVAAGTWDGVLPLGDLQYDCGTLSNFQNSYDLAWGFTSGTSLPVPGNHEYQASSSIDTEGCSPTAAGYYSYFSSKGNPQPANGYYTSLIGSWRVIALNSNCTAVGGCKAGNPEYTWLQGVLQADNPLCTVAYWHHAPWSSQGRSQGVGAMRPIWALLANSGVDLVLVGHFHHYERFTDLNASGTPVLPGTGTREIVVGTGGEGLGGFNTTPRPGSDVRNAKTFGILSVTLGTGAYSWSFLPAAPGTFTDSGSDTCH